MSEERQTEATPQEETPATEPAAVIPEEEASNPARPPPNTVFRCPKCRMPLFKGSDVIPHEATKERKFARKRQQFASKESGCTSFFIEQPKWLDATGRMSDTIYCPKCNYKIGHFSWIGSQCSCGEWIKPSFQIPISRVDSV